MSYKLDETTEISQEALELSLRQAVAVRNIPDGCFKDYLQVKAHMPYNMDSQVLQLWTYVLAEELGKIEKSVYFEFPTSAWQHFKFSYAPKWYLKRFPVKTKAHEKIVTCIAEEWYPTLPKIKGYKHLIHSFKFGPAKVSGSTGFEVKEED